MSCSTFFPNFVSLTWSSYSIRPSLSNTREFSLAVDSGTECNLLKFARNWVMHVLDTATVEAHERRASWFLLSARTSSLSQFAWLMVGGTSLSLVLDIHFQIDSVHYQIYIGFGQVCLPGHPWNTERSISDVFLFSLSLLMEYSSQFSPNGRYM